MSQSSSARSAVDSVQQSKSAKNDTALVSDASRRRGLAEAIAEETGIEESMIETLVRRFYAKVRADALLGPVFEARIADWEPHLKQMCAFWSSVALMTG